jgi:integrase
MPERLRLMVTLASWCTPRFGETVELRRGDIDLSEEVIRVRRAAVRAGGTFQITTPKSDAGIRDVNIPPRIIPAIEDHLAKHVGRGRDSLLFPAGDSVPRSPTCGGSVAPPVAAASTASLAELMARLGHSTPQTRGSTSRPDPVIAARPQIPLRPTLLGHEHCSSNSLRYDVRVILADWSPSGR